MCPSLSRTNETPDEPPGSYRGLLGVLLGSHSSVPTPLARPAWSLTVLLATLDGGGDLYLEQEI